VPLTPTLPANERDQVQPGTSGTPTPEAQLQMAAWRSRTDGYRLDVLNQHLVPIGQLHPIAPGITIDNNINRDVKRTMSGLVLPRAEVASVNYFQNRLRPVHLVAGQEYPLGVFLISDASSVRHSWGQTAELTLADQGLILSQLLDRSIGYSGGQSVRQAMVEVTEQLALPAVEIDPSEARFGGVATWSMGRDTWQRVLNDLAALAGFTSGYFDNVGTYQLRRAPTTDNMAEADHNYDHPDRVYADSIVESNATLESPNRYVVISTSGNLPTAVVGTWDVPASAPHSYENRGFRVLAVTERQGLSLVQANDTARVLGQQGADTYQWASFAAAPDPRHDTFQTVVWQGAVWREQAWSVGMSAGAEHRHELRRSYLP
jgi:hypothetical protein